jgi:hypothetical protein
MNDESNLENLSEAARELVRALQSLRRPWPHRFSGKEVHASRPPHSSHAVRELLRAGLLVAPFTDRDVLDLRVPDEP